MGLGHWIIIHLRLAQSLAPQSQLIERVQFTALHLYGNIDGDDRRHQSHEFSMLCEVTHRALLASRKPSCQLTQMQPQVPIRRLASMGYHRRVSQVAVNVEISIWYSATVSAIGNGALRHTSLVGASLATLADSE